MRRARGNDDRVDIERFEKASALGSKHCPVAGTNPRYASERGSPNIHSAACDQLLHSSFHLRSDAKAMNIPDRPHVSATRRLSMTRRFSHMSLPCAPSASTKLCHVIPRSSASRSVWRTLWSNSLSEVNGSDRKSPKGSCPTGPWPRDRKPLREKDVIWPTWPLLLSDATTSAEVKPFPTMRTRSPVSTASIG